MTGDSDDDLMTRFQCGRDLAAFEELFRRHRDTLLRFLLRLVGNPAGAEDASQQTWLKVVEVARKGNYATAQAATFRTWLFTLARNHVIDEHQRKFAATRTVPLPDGPGDQLLRSVAGVDPAAADPATHAMRDELAQRIQQAITMLPMEQREVIALWCAGLAPMDIATITSAPRETVLSRKKYAISKLRESLRDVLAVERRP